MKTSTIKKRLILLLQRRGSIGKSTIVCLLAQFLNSAGKDWRGFDLDPDHETFHKMFKDNVTLVPLGTEPEADIIRVLKQARENTISIIDPQAHAGDKVRETLRKINFATRFSKEDDGRLTILLFVSDDLEVLVNIQEIVQIFGPSVDYLLIKNRVKNRERVGRMFEGSEMADNLAQLGARTIEVPMLLTWALNHLSSKELELGRSVSHLEYIKNSDLDADPEAKYVVEDWLHSVFTSYMSVSDLFIPGGLGTQSSGQPSQQPIAPARRSIKLNRANL